MTSGEGIATGYANGGTTVSKGSNATAPDGTLTAWNSVYNGTSGDASLYKAGGEITTTNSTSYTLSVFAKVPSTNTYITGVRLRTYNSNHAGGFNLLTGTVLGTAEGTTTNRIEAYPNGWYRCSITFTSGTDGNQGVQFYLINNASTALNSSSANGEELYLWGVQLEQGSFPTSYIPTSGSTVTRAADIAKITGTNFTDFYNQSEGTIIAEYRVPPEKNDSTIWGITGASDADRITHYLRAASSGSFRFDTTVSSAFTSAIQITNPRPNVYKTGLGISPQNIKAIIDGGTLYEDTVRSGNIPTVTQLLIGNTTTTSTGSGLGHMSRLSYYNKRLPDAQLQGLTQQ